MSIQAAGFLFWSIGFFCGVMFVIMVEILRGKP